MRPMSAIHVTPLTDAQKAMPAAEPVKRDGEWLMGVSQAWTDTPVAVGDSVIVCAARGKRWEATVGAICEVYENAPELSYAELEDIEASMRAHGADEATVTRLMSEIKRDNHGSRYTVCRKA